MKKTKRDSRPIGTIHPLTPREQQVLQKMVEGMTSKETGAALGMSNRTAETHRVNIYRKTRTTSIAELVVWAIKTKAVTI